MSAAVWLVPGAAACGLPAGYVAARVAGLFPRQRPPSPGAAAGGDPPSEPDPGTAPAYQAISPQERAISSPEHDGDGPGPLPPGRQAGAAVATAVLYALLAWRIGENAALLAYLPLFALLVSVTLIDVAHRIVPRVLVYSGLAVTGAMLVVAAVIDGHYARIEDAAIGGAASFVFFLVVHLVSPRGMGFGDVRLSGLLGASLGWMGLSVVYAGMFVAFFTGAAVGLVLMVAFGANRKTAIPFAPYLAFGCVVGVLFGHALVGGWDRLLRP